MCEFLLNKGAEIEVKDRWGGSPLEDAIKFKHDSIIRLFRERKELY